MVGQSWPTTLGGTRHDDVIHGYQGNDVIRAGRGAVDVLDGVRGDDVLRAATGTM